MYWIVSLPYIVLFWYLSKQAIPSCSLFAVPFQMYHMVFFSYFSDHDTVELVVVIGGYSTGAVEVKPSLFSLSYSKNGQMYVASFVVSDIVNRWFQFSSQKLDKKFVYIEVFCHLNLVYRSICSLLLPQKKLCFVKYLLTTLHYYLTLISNFYSVSV